MTQPSRDTESTDESTEESATDTSAEGQDDAEGQDGPPPPPAKSAGRSSSRTSRGGRKPRGKAAQNADVEPATQDASDEPSPQDASDEPVDEPTAGATDDDRRKVPMTAADYARTTTGDPAATSVIPAVRDDDDTTTEYTAASSARDEDDGPRQARLNLVHVDPWSVTKLAFVVSVALMIVSVVAVTVFWVVLNITGVWGSLNETINSVLSSEDGTFDVTNYVGLGRVLGLTLVLSCVNVILMTALAAIGARLYNVAAVLVGGVQVTFADRS